MLAHSWVCTGLLCNSQVHIANAVTSDLCPQLLDHEPKAAEQVPLLMKMKKDELALSKAIESGDTDLGETYFITYLLM